MMMTYLGYLQKHDPLYAFMYDKIQPQLCLSGARDYKVFRLQASNTVYLYEETQTHTRLIGKFYHNYNGQNRDNDHANMEREYANLEFMRNNGFNGFGYHYIARPLGKSSQLNELLMEECCYGESLSSIIKRSIQERNQGLLYSKLTALAYFLSCFHNRTHNGYHVDFEPVTTYAHGILKTLFHNNLISEHRYKKLGSIVCTWHDKPAMWADEQVIVHGDATPENFLFGDDLHVISFDLERMRTADRLFDVGRLVAELAHFFMLFSGNRYNAEPFIGHFLWEYSCHFPDRNAAFYAISERLPFYMGINLLRIARNNYFTWDYRQKLLNAASECLKSGR